MIKEYKENKESSSLQMAWFFLYEKLYKYVIV